MSNPNDLLNGSGKGALKGKIVPIVTLQDMDRALSLAPRMRKEHVDEVWASHAYTPAAAIHACLDKPGRRSMLVLDHVVEAIFGVVPMEMFPERGVIWLLSSNALDKYREQLIKLAPIVLQHYLAQFEILTNFVDARFQAALRWAEFLGFDVLPPRAFGPFNLPFCQIVLRRK